MLSAYEYRVLFVTPDFLPGAGNNTTVPLTPDITNVYDLVRDNPETFEMLTQAECYTIYGNPYVTNRSDVIVILNSTEYQAQLKSPVSIMPTINYSMPTSPIKISKDFIQDKLEEAHQEPLLFDSQVEIDGCLSKKAKEGCRLWICSPIFIVVMVCNLVKAAVMITIFRGRNQQFTPLVTMGDAIGSFLERPNCASSHLTSCGLALGISGAIFHAATGGRATDQPLKLGFNSISETSIIDLGTTGKSTASAVFTILLVNLPQVLFSMIYLFYNSIFTSMLGAYEWSRFGNHRKTLRVTSPIGDQRSAYYLQMPFKYGLSFLLCSFLFHWLISQSLYFARIAVYDLNENYTPGNDISTTGYSPEALLIILSLGSFLLLVFGIGTGFPPGFGIFLQDSPLLEAAARSLAPHVMASMKMRIPDCAHCNGELFTSPSHQKGSI